MKIGLKSLLFGAHQFVLHPLFVTLAWKDVYSEWPTWKELVCIIVHDWGYYSAGALDRSKDLRHPELGARIVWKLFDDHKLYHLCLGHSRSYAKAFDIPVSKLCLPDKQSIKYHPTWLYALCCGLTGELEWYRKNYKYKKAGWISLSKAIKKQMMSYEGE